jgi:hypothetical protein
MNYNSRSVCSPSRCGKQMQVPQAPMERNWLILGRVIRVEQPEAQAQGDHAAVGEAEIAAQAENAAVGEAEIAAQAQLEESVMGVNTVPAAAAAREAGFSIAIAPPPRVTFLTARQNSNPIADRGDTCPYIIASGPSCLLAHFAVAPYRGTDFTRELSGPRMCHHLVVARHFRRKGGLVVASRERIPARDYPFVPALRNIMCVGFFCDHNYNCRIAELMVEARNPLLRLVVFRAEWYTITLRSPLVYWDSERRWVPHGAVAIDSTVLWFDLSWGILSCDIEAEMEDMEIYFARLPRGRGLPRGGATEGMDSRRCVAVSRNMLRYVEIIVPNPNPNGEAAAAMVSMWSLPVAAGDEDRREWITNYRVSFEDIWNSDSYAVTGLQRDIPVLAGVCPANPSVVYFDLHQRLFGVDVPERRVVDYEAKQHELVNAQGDDGEKGSSRYLIIWDLMRQGFFLINFDRIVLLKFFRKK